jgi:hypothetical protein
MARLVEAPLSEKSGCRLPTDTAEGCDLAIRVAELSRIHRGNSRRGA